MTSTAQQILYSRKRLVRLDLRIRAPAGAVHLLVTERRNVFHMLRDYHDVVLLQKDSISFSSIAPPDDNANLCSLGERILARVSIDRAT